MNDRLPSGVTQFVRRQPVYSWTSRSSHCGGVDADVLLGTVTDVPIEIAGRSPSIPAQSANAEPKNDCLRKSLLLFSMTLHSYCTKKGRTG